MISLHIPYLEKQPIKMSVLFLIMARMLILILQVKYDKFCWNMVKNRFHYVLKGIVLVHIYLRFGCFQILLLTRVQLELTRR